MKHIVIYMYIKAVTNNVKLRLYLWHDIYNIFLKIEEILYYSEVKYNEGQNTTKFIS